jgi:hypothetical protein
MSKRIIHLFVGAFVLLVCASLAFGAAADKDKGAAVAKTTSNDDYKAFTINNIFNYYSNNGDGSYNKYSSNGAFEFPKGTGKTAMFEDGVVWGGFHKGRSDPKVGGSVYRHGLQAGPIITVGGAAESERAVAADPLDAKYHVYRVRPDVSPTTAFSAVQSVLADEAALINRYETATAQKLYDAYVKDWNEWPAKSASNPTGMAPFTDKNGNGLYEPAIDVPGQPGSDQTMYYVSNDLNATLSQNLAGCPPIGLEVHRTFWGYNRQGALGNTIFASTVVINKSGAPIDSMFMVQWADPDLGDSGDDYAGCDKDRSLGFIYNGRPIDGVYGKACPSSGYDFFQGPIVAGEASDSAVFRLQYRHGFKNLGMSTFVFFSQGFAAYADPAQGTGGDVAWYRLMNGYTAAGGNAFVNPLTNQPTKFTLDGDPVTGQGWLDGMAGLTPQDRRICLVTGPFTMANGDTQELVVANLVGLGGDRISSVAVLKWYSDLAQFAYNSLFNIPTPPPAPKVNVAALDGEISLSWGDPNIFNALEAHNSGGYAFEGYNVYQMPENAFTKSTARLLATYDVVNAITTVFDDVYDDATGYVLKKPVQFGTDSGIKRTYQATTDALTSRNLINGTTYYFAVTAYAVNTDPLAKPTNLESSPQVLTIIPEKPRPGYTVATVGDTIAAANIVHTNSAGGKSDGQVIPTIVNPMALTGGVYKVVFVGAPPAQTWSLVRTLGGRVDTVARNLSDQSGSDDGSIVVDGIQWRVIGAPNNFKRFLVTANANGPLNPPVIGTYAFNGNGFPTLDGNASDGVNDRPPTSQQKSGTLWGIATGNNGNASVSTYDYFLTRTARGTGPGVGGNWARIMPYDYECRFTAAGGKAEMAFTSGSMVDVPFELWNIGINTPTNTADDYRMIPWVNDVNGDEKFDLDSVDHPLSGGDNDPETDWIYWMNPVDKTPGQAGYNAWAPVDPQTDDATDAEVFARMVFVAWNGGSISDPTFPANLKAPLPETGTVFRILTTKPNQATDVFTVSVPTYQYEAAKATADIGNVNVFPNPYIGFNPLEANKYQRFVTFTHLPSHAVIRVFNLAGILIRTLEKRDATQFYQWDLRNEDGFPISAGMYVAYVDMPELGKTKILKLGVIPEQQFIDRW